MKLLTKTAFYPCCASDIRRPLEILNGYVDEVVFCDPNPYLKREWPTLMAAKAVSLPHAHLISDDARRGVRELERIDVLFYRRDSNGEGGSALMVLSKLFLPQVLEKMPPEGGLIITDGSNRGNHFYTKAFRPQGVNKFGWHIQALGEQPFEESDELSILKVTRLT